MKLLFTFSIGMLMLQQHLINAQVCGISVAKLEGSDSPETTPTECSDAEESACDSRLGANPKSFCSKAENARKCCFSCQKYFTSKATNTEGWCRIPEDPDWIKGVSDNVLKCENQDTPGNCGKYASQGWCEALASGKACHVAYVADKCRKSCHDRVGKGKASVFCA